ncbi:unnamed protein product [Chrysodeixis includens]|uniref:ABC transporter domain-containing protein n=1 Tax=Chrysodeixis includens TaxID=689277 RepID=A0A9N8KTI4_CHRIL|nr:unnamed protein product [Chrysodeixis includens]
MRRHTLEIAEVRNLIQRWVGLHQLDPVIGTPKDVIPLQIPGVYKVDCSCRRSYIGQTIQAIAERVKEHIAALIVAVVAGLFLGFSLSSVLVHMDPNVGSKKILTGETLTVEDLGARTTLVLRADNGSASRSIASACDIININTLSENLKANVKGVLTDIVQEADILQKDLLTPKEIREYKPIILSNRLVKPANVFPGSSKSLISKYDIFWASVSPDDCVLIMPSFNTMTNVPNNSVKNINDKKSFFDLSDSDEYVMSETNALERQVKNMEYTALPHTESLTEYLVTRAIDSPQLYVYLYAYGMDVATDAKGMVTVQALYSPLHHDHGAAARSLARVYMALLRHYTGFLDATIKVDDDPLALDLSPWMKDVATPPLFIQFLLILTISHITLLPSKEHGLIRHVQKHALNFSPFRYWITLYLCDLMLYWVLVGVMSIVIITIVFLTMPITHFQSVDLMIVPVMLLAYGIGCVPQAYVFSLGPRMALNTMTFVIVNLVFGETTILAKIFYGDALNYALDFMSLSPQFNMAYAYVKIKQIFLYNSECIIIQSKDLCSVNTFHKCCQKCGILQECFRRKSYFTRYPGILMEVTAMFTTALFFTVLLIFIEYRTFHRLWDWLTSGMANRDLPKCDSLQPGAERELCDVLDKKAQLTNKRAETVDTFGEYLLASDITLRSGGQYVIHNVFLGIGKGEAIALSGLKCHGRLKLCEMLAGYRDPSHGSLCSMSQYMLETNPHEVSAKRIFHLNSERDSAYAVPHYQKLRVRVIHIRDNRKGQPSRSAMGRSRPGRTAFMITVSPTPVSLSCENSSLPSWMYVKDALELIATLRGVPRHAVKGEVRSYIEALELTKLAYSYVENVRVPDRPRLHFAAAVIGAPPVVVVDECTASQKISVRRAMYSILYTLKKQGRAIFISSSSIESHMPVTNRLAILQDGRIYDIDGVDRLVQRYSSRGYTVVVHLKDEVDVNAMFARYFEEFAINDTSDVLVNVQVLDRDMKWASIFEKMEILKAENDQVYSYIVTVIPIDYIYNSIVNVELGHRTAKGLFSWKWLKKVMSIKPEVMPKPEALANLIPFEQKYDITKLKELPWSVIFHR